jgi:hypothetical protein
MRPSYQSLSTAFQAAADAVCVGLFVRCCLEALISVLRSRSIDDGQLHGP